MTADILTETETLLRELFALQTRVRQVYLDRAISGIPRQGQTIYAEDHLDGAIRSLLSCFKSLQLDLEGNSPDE